MASEHRCPRGRESAQPGPGLMRAERVNPARVPRTGAGMRGACGRPRAMGAESRLAGQGAQEAGHTGVSSEPGGPALAPRVPHGRVSEFPTRASRYGAWLSYRLGLDTLVA